MTHGYSRNKRILTVGVLAVVMVLSVLALGAGTAAATSPVEQSDFSDIAVNADDPTGNIIVTATVTEPGFDRSQKQLNEIRIDFNDQAVAANTLDNDDVAVDIFKSDGTVRDSIPTGDITTGDSSAAVARIDTSSKTDVARTGDRIRIEITNNGGGLDLTALGDDDVGITLLANEGQIKQTDDAINLSSSEVDGDNAGNVKVAGGSTTYYGSLVTALSQASSGDTVTVQESFDEAFTQYQGSGTASASITDGTAFSTFDDDQALPGGSATLDGQSNTIYFPSKADGNKLLTASGSETIKNFDIDTKSFADAVGDTGQAGTAVDINAGGITVKDSTFTDVGAGNTNPAIDVSDNDNLEVSGNSISIATGSSSTGIKASGTLNDEVDIVDNTNIDTNGGIGIDLNSNDIAGQNEGTDDVNVSGNTVDSDAIGIDIGLSSATSNVTAVGNDITFTGANNGLNVETTGLAGAYSVGPLAVNGTTVSSDGTGDGVGIDVDFDSGDKAPDTKFDDVTIDDVQTAISVGSTAGSTDAGQNTFNVTNSQIGQTNPVGTGIDPSQYADSSTDPNIDVDFEVDSTDIEASTTAILLDTTTANQPDTLDVQVDGGTIGGSGIGIDVANNHKGALKFTGSATQFKDTGAAIDLTSISSFNLNDGAIDENDVTLGTQNNPVTTGIQVNQNGLSNSELSITGLDIELDDQGGHGIHLKADGPDYKLDDLTVTGTPNNGGDGQTGIDVKPPTTTNLKATCSNTITVNGVDDGVVFDGGVDIECSQIDGITANNIGNGAGIKLVDTADARDLIIDGVTVENTTDDSDATGIDIDETGVSKITVKNADLGYSGDSLDDGIHAGDGTVNLVVESTDIGLAKGDGTGIDQTGTGNLDIQSGTTTIDLEANAGTGINYDAGANTFTLDDTVNIGDDSDNGYARGAQAAAGIVVQSGTFDITNDNPEFDQGKSISDVNTGLELQGTSLTGTPSNTISGATFDRMGNGDAISVTEAYSNNLVLEDITVNAVTDGNLESGTTAINFNADSDNNLDVKGTTELGTSDNEVDTGIDVSGGTTSGIGTVTVAATNVDIALSNSGGDGITFSTTDSSGTQNLNINGPLTIDGPAAGDISANADHASSGITVDGDGTATDVSFGTDSNGDAAASNLDISGVDTGLQIVTANSLSTSTGSSEELFLGSNGAASGSTQFSEMGSGTAIDIQPSAVSSGGTLNVTGVPITFEQETGTGLSFTGDDTVAVSDVTITGVSDGSGQGVNINLDGSTSFSFDDATSTSSSTIQDVNRGLHVQAASDLTNSENGGNTIKGTEFLGISGDTAAIDVQTADVGNLNFTEITVSGDGNNPGADAIQYNDGGDSDLVVVDSDLGAGTASNKLGNGIDVNNDATIVDVSQDTTNIGVTGAGAGAGSGILINDGGDAIDDVDISGVTIDGSQATGSYGIYVNSVDSTASGQDIKIDHGVTTDSAASQIDNVEIGIQVDEAGSGNNGLENIGHTQFSGITGTAIDINDVSNIESSEFVTSGISVDGGTGATAINYDGSSAGNNLKVVDSGLGNDTTNSPKTSLDTGIDVSETSSADVDVTVDSTEIGLADNGATGIDYSGSTSGSATVDIVNSLTIEGQTTNYPGDTASTGILVDDGNTDLTFSSNADQNLFINGTNVGIDLTNANDITGTDTITGATFSEISGTALNVDTTLASTGTLTVDSAIIESSSEATGIYFSSEGSTALNVTNADFRLVDAGVDVAATSGSSGSADNNFNLVDSSINVQDAADAFGIRVNADDINPTIERNTITSNGQSSSSVVGIIVADYDDTQASAGDSLIFLNDINGFSADGAYGLNGSEATTLPEETAVLNYWGSSDGPRADGGSNVVLNVDGEQASEERTIDPFLTVDTATVLSRNDDQAAVEDLSDITVNNIESFGHSLTIESGDTAVFPGESDRTIDESLTGSSGVVYEFNESTESYDQITDLTRKPNALDDIAFAQQADTQEQLIVEYDNGTSTPTTKEYHTGINVVATMAGDSTLDNSLSTAGSTGAVESTQTFSLGTSDLNTDENVTIAYDDEAEHAPYDQSARTQAINASLYDDGDSSVADEVSPFGVAYIFIDQDDEDFYQSIDRTTPESADQVLTNRGANKNVYDFEDAS